MTDRSLLREAQYADLLIVGTGIAGLFAAVTALDAGQRVVLMSKSTARESNTNDAQGGIAAPIGPGDSPSLHFRDTVGCGAELNDVEAVATLTAEARDCLNRLLEVGVPFDRDENGLALTREAAHSRSRVIHAGGDATGAAIQEVLLREAIRGGAIILEQTQATELIKSADRVVGVRVSRTEAGVERPVSLFAPRVVLATGGAGRLFSRTTNPSIATGDGLGLAFRAGAELVDLEFFQFHPTALAAPGAPAFLISEAARGEGGILRDPQSRAFMGRYHADRELAPRDVVSRAIWSEMTEHGLSHVLLDLTHIPPGRVTSRFPTITAVCRRWGIDITREPVPVAPAAHYFMGGVRTDLEGRTSVLGLFAVGEVAGTGVHGANRLASNSLLEGLVFGRRVALADDRGPQLKSPIDAVAWSRPHDSGVALQELAHPKPPRISVEELRELNWKNCGLIRDGGRLSEQLEILPLRQDHPSGATLSNTGDRNMALVSRLMAHSALLREESRGAHFRADFPESADHWRGHIVVSLDGVCFMPMVAPTTCVQQPLAQRHQAAPNGAREKVPA